MCSKGERTGYDRKGKDVDGRLYAPSDPELTQLRLLARKLARQYNQTGEDEPQKLQGILRELLASSSEILMLLAPVHFDYGCNTCFGKNCMANFNFVCLDVCPVQIGDNVLFGPNVTLATPLHPLLPEERNLRQRSDRTWYNLEYGAPITMEDDCWIAANVFICAGVTVGRGSVIAAGSVVTRDIPADSLAAGVPCRVIRSLTEEDRMPQRLS